jgi:hypothetical protein
LISIQLASVASVLSKRTSQIEFTLRETVYEGKRVVDQVCGEPHAGGVVWAVSGRRAAVSNVSGQVFLGSRDQWQAGVYARRTARAGWEIRRAWLAPFAAEHD